MQGLSQDNKVTETLRNSENKKQEKGEIMGLIMDPF